MRQALADHIDQLDLALDQLAMRDRNFDRFALMLVDNVVELTLHQHASDNNRENKLRTAIKKLRIDPGTVRDALGPHFNAKVKLAKCTGLVTPELAESLQCLHGFRNTAYHQGARHEGILRSIALTYFRMACTVLGAYEPRWWSYGSSDRISHRAMKYVGPATGTDDRKAFRAAWDRLSAVADSMDNTLVPDLCKDMEKAIRRADSQLTFLEENSPGKPAKNRVQIMLESQSWYFAFSEAGRTFATKKGCPEKISVGDRVAWMASHYPMPVRTDPVPGWKKRLASLKKERGVHAALKKYCEFMRQTDEAREVINVAADQLDAHIQDQIDFARGK